MKKKSKQQKIIELTAAGIMTLSTCSVPLYSNAIVAMATEASTINGSTISKESFLKNFTQLGSALNNYDESTGIQKMTTGSQQAGVVTFNNNIDLQQSFHLDIDINVGTAPAADGIGIAFYTGEKQQIGGTAGNLGIYGIPNAFGWKIDTWQNNESMKSNPFQNPKDIKGENDKGKQVPYGAFVTTNASGIGTIDSTSYQKISNSFLDGQYHKLSINYDGNMGLTVDLDYNGTVYHFSKNLNGIVDQNAELHFNISSSTGGYPTNHSIKFNTMTYTSIADKPAINNVKDSDTSVSGTGTPGNSVTIYDESGKNLGTTTVKEDGTWSIPVDEGTLKAGESLKATQKATGSNRDSEPATSVVSEDKAADKPTINNAKDSDTSVSGTGTPGDSVTVYDESGKKLGTTTVKEDGTWSIPVDEGTLKAGESLKATQKAPGSNRDSEPATSVVSEDKAADKPTINNAKDSDTSVSGTGTPGDSVTVYDESGKKLGTTTVKEDGTWSIPVDEGTLKANEKLSATQKAPGSNRDSEPATSVVSEDKAADKPTINNAKDSDTSVSGTGTPGNSVTVYDESGKKLGTTTVKEDGTWSIPVDEGTLKAGENLKATQKAPGSNRDSEPATSVVSEDKAADKPTINNAKDSDTSLSGTGTPGDSVTVYDESGKKLGITTVKEDGTWSIPVDEGTLKAGESLKATQKAPGSNRDSEPATSVVSEDKAADKPVINNAKDSDTSVSGTGTPGNSVTVYDESGKKLGTTTVKEDGTWSIPVDEGTLKANEKLSATQKAPGSNRDSEPATSVVSEDKAADKPTINNAKDSDTSVSGTGTPGDSVTVYDESGKNLGTTTVKEDGTWSIPVDEGTLKAGENLKATQKAPGSNRDSEPATSVVSEDKAADKPTINNAKDSDTSVSGTGTPGDSVTVYDESGKKLGTTTVKEDGTWSIPVDEGTLKVGETLKATQKAPGSNRDSEPTTSVVSEDKAADKPVINNAKDSDTSVSGTGTPGDSVTVYDESGKKLGTTTVKEDGTWSIPVDEGTLKANEKLSATQKAPGSNRDSEPATSIVSEDKAADKPVINNAKDSDTSVSGTGTPGNSVTVYDESGKKLGTTTVKEDGTWSIPVDEGTLKANEKLSAT
ncbi:Ig-like domain-containing protein, partial [Vagococcus entomophilus]